MDTLENMRAFLATVRTGSFSESGRQLGVAPSVISKRIGQLEWKVRGELFNRSTRSVTLTELGEQFLPHIRGLVTHFDDALTGMAKAPGGLVGRIRIKVPSTLGTPHLASSFTAFQKAHPQVLLDIVMQDGSVNPVEEGFDIALAALPELYANVEDESLCPYPRLVCAAPAYLAQRGTPRHPRELSDHDCLVFTPSGSMWQFESGEGIVRVDVRSRFTSNNSGVLMASACDGNGIAVLAARVAAPALADGRLVRVLEDFPLPELWLKALMPRNRARLPRVRALLDWIHQDLSDPGLPPEAAGRKKPAKASVRRRKA